MARARWSTESVRANGPCFDTHRPAADRRWPGAADCLMVVGSLYWIGTSHEISIPAGESRRFPSEGWQTTRKARSGGVGVESLRIDMWRESRGQLYRITRHACWLGGRPWFEPLDGRGAAGRARAGVESAMGVRR